MTEHSRWVAHHVTDPSKPKSEGTVRLMCMSDTHTKHNDIPQSSIFPADIAIHAGDFTMYGHRSEIISFRDWYVKLPATHKLLIAGNHDLSLDDKMRDELKDVFILRGYTEPPESCKCEITNCKEITYLEDEVINLMGVKFFCSPRSPHINKFCFPSKIENNGKEWEKIDSSFDVVVTHSPPSGVFDFDIRDGQFGDPFLALKIQEAKTPLHIFGHTHCCNGSYRHGNTLYVNAAIVDINDEYNCPPIYIDLVKSDEKFEEPDHYFSLPELIDLSFYRNTINTFI